VSDIRDEVLKCLETYSKSDDVLIAELEKIVSVSEERVYPLIIHILTHLELEADNAKKCWENIIEHRKKLSKELKRDVSLRTTICDYFCSIDISLKNPKVVEIHIFERKDKASKYDNLTGLYNRSYFDDSLKREIARAERHQLELSILFFDLDNFKNVNDSYGHLAGDLILKNVAGIIKEEIRIEDFAARYGGEEMVVILPQTGKIQGLILGERIRESIEEYTHQFKDQSIKITVSGGLATFPSDTKKGDELLKLADNALYEAKGSGKNNISVYSKLKRRYFRINFDSEIQVQNIKVTDRKNNFQVSSKNFSRTGILFESKQPFQIGDKLELSIPIYTTPKPEVVDVTGTVVRLEVYENGRYEIGVSFIEMGKDLKFEIQNYIIKQLDKIYF
jgi:diguanylate cyclase (GGDEF)-like protein